MVGGGCWLGGPKVGGSKSRFHCQCQDCAIRWNFPQENCCACGKGDPANHVRSACEYETRPHYKQSECDGVDSGCSGENDGNTNNLPTTTTTTPLPSPSSSATTTEVQVGTLMTTLSGIRTTTPPETTTPLDNLETTTSLGLLQTTERQLVEKKNERIFETIWCGDGSYSMGRRESIWEAYREDPTNQNICGSLGCSIPGCSLMKCSTLPSWGEKIPHSPDDESSVSDPVYHIHCVNDVLDHEEGISIYITK